MKKVRARLREQRMTEQKIQVERSNRKPLGAHYAYRVEVPWDLGSGHRFNRNKVLIGPYVQQTRMQAVPQAGDANTPTRRYAPPSSRCPWRKSRVLNSRDLLAGPAMLLSRSKCH
jgi:pullulanase/glycogen debranching enzyme